MNFKRVCFTLLLAGSLPVLALPAMAQNDKDAKAESNLKDHKKVATETWKNATIWHDPGDIGSLDMTYGQGGPKHLPQGPYVFVAEDKNGTNPKFDVRDANGKKWRVKLGEEARPEVVASRLLWAMGYYANDDYLVASADVPGLVLSRGGLKGATHVENVRFARKPGGENKLGTWEWKKNPFVGTREFNGLRVMMAVLNNWDLKDENNAVYTNEKEGADPVFLVSDIGASFATNNREISRGKDKGNLGSYQNSKFITKVTATAVSFGTPAPPTGAFIESAGMLSRDYFRRSGLQYIGRDIPIADVKWIGGMLGQLSHKQLMDAFTAGFDQATAVQFVSIVEARIAELKGLK